MRKKRTPIVLALASLLASLVTFVSSGTAVAAEYIPELQRPTQVLNRYAQGPIVSSNGSVTEGCEGSNNVKTFSAAGQLVREISYTQQIDGVQNCIWTPKVDKNGDLYGQPYGKTTSGSYAVGANLLAYSGNTLKWKYPTGCTSSTASPAIGADGNVYFINGNNRLVGVTSNVAPSSTQPAKVLDVAASGGCGADLRPYKDGLAVIGSTGRPTFYSYSGVNLGLVSTGYVSHHAQINAAGRFFYDTYTESGGLRSIKITAFEGVTQKVAWERTASADSAYVYGADLRSTPDGGVLALLNEKKLVGGAQTSERVRTLVKLNSMGSKLWSKTLPNETASGSTFETGGSFVTDSNGNAAIVRNGTVNVNGKTGKGVSIGVFDGNGNAVYDKVMHGNFDSAAGPTYGFSNTSEPAIWTGTLYLKVQCSGSCSSYLETKLYPIKVPGLGLDYPRGAVLTVPSPLKPYAALGDSYSSGQGAGMYDSDTVTSTNKCYKSYSGYGRILGRDTSSPLMLTNFAACGGSITDNIDTNTTYPGVTQKQDEALSSNTKVVSLTIGGNDIGFADVITTCADPTKDCDGAYSLAYNRLGVLDNKLQRVYLDILQKAPNAKVYVLGYPPIVITGPGCMVGNNGSDYPIFSESRKQKAVDLANSLNTAIQTNVNTIRQLSNYDQRLKFIDAAASGSPFIGHDVCSSDPYVNGLILPPGTLPRASTRTPRG